MQLFLLLWRKIFNYLIKKDVLQYLNFDSAYRCKIMCSLNTLWKVWYGETYLGIIQ